MAALLSFPGMLNRGPIMAVIAGNGAYYPSVNLVSMSVVF